MSSPHKSRLRKRSTSEKSDSLASRNPAPSQSASRATFAPTSRASKVLLGLVLVVVASFYVYDDFATLLTRSEPLAESYALCSRGGAQQIYTVDPESPRSECVLVHKDRFLTSGSFGT